MASLHKLSVEPAPIYRGSPSAQGEIIRVSTHAPCPICDKPDWCGIFDDGSAAICMRVESDRPTQNGGWLHFLYDRPIPTDPRPLFAAPQDHARAGAEALNTVYHALIGELHLSPKHTQDLLHRGLSPEEVKCLRSQGYATLPDGLERLPLVNELVERFDATLLSVPGFYLTRHNRIWLAGASGLLIPCRDVNGRIVGAQVRVDEGQSGGKYRWMSATQKQRQRGGVSSGTPLHVATPVPQSLRGSERGVRSDGVLGVLGEKKPLHTQPSNHPTTPSHVWITEGIIKADIAALKLGETVIGIAGVGSWNKEEIKQTLSHLAPTQVIIAFDADTTINPAVRKQRKRLAQAVTGMGYRVSIARWDLRLGKGIDELLVACHTPTLEPFRPPVAIETLKTSPKHDGKKRVRRTPPPPENPTAAAETAKGNTTEAFHLRDLRCQLRDRIEHFALLGQGALLIKATQGLGKTVTAIDVIDTLWHNGLLRPIYTPARTDP
ncbi:DUF3854 domain-containing protein [Candidatus Poribacteria bacterium]|nr:DUF3854 domain-containing protein [Candidatus Poribacteria bacterium]